MKNKLTVYLSFASTPGNSIHFNARTTWEPTARAPFIH